jgi:hypothetical protein
MQIKAPIWMIATLTALAFQTAGAQAVKREAVASTRTDAGSSEGGSADPVKTLRAAAEALGMLRWSDIGTENVHLPAVDVVNTLEIWGSGTTYSAGQPYKAEYHVCLGYNPAAMRVDITRTSFGVAQSTASQRTIEVVRDGYAWDESEIGGGLVPGQGTATPAITAAKRRLLQLWILPYAVVKAAFAVGDKTKISNENGSTIIVFPLSGSLAGVMVRATLNDKNEVVKVETRSNDPTLSDMVTKTEYSDYADHGEILTDIKSPGHILQEQDGQPALDLHVTKVDANNPYLVFPVPENVKKAKTH